MNLSPTLGTTTKSMQNQSPTKKSHFLSSYHAVGRLKQNFQYVFRSRFMTCHEVGYFS
jgi:hypothetical protein